MFDCGIASEQALVASVATLPYPALGHSAVLQLWSPSPLAAQSGGLRVTFLQDRFKGGTSTEKWLFSHFSQRYLDSELRNVARSFSPDLPLYSRKLTKTETSIGCLKWQKLVPQVGANELCLWKQESSYQFDKFVSKKLRYGCLKRDHFIQFGAHGTLLKVTNISKYKRHLSQQIFN